MSNIPFVIHRSLANQLASQGLMNELPAILQRLVFLPNPVESLEKFRIDFQTWALFVLKSPYVPENIVELVIPVSHRLCILGGAGLQNIVTGKDGFVTWYEIGDLLFHITDTRFDFRVLVIDKLAKPEEDEGLRELAAQRIISKVLQDKMSCYPNGQERKVVVTAEALLSIFAYNWKASSREHDTQPFADDLSTKLGCFWHCYSDGKASVFVFSKALSQGLEGYESPNSRFQVDALFCEEPEGMGQSHSILMDYSEQESERRRIEQDLLSVLDDDDIQKNKPLVYIAAIEAIGEIGSDEAVHRLCDLIDYGASNDQPSPASIALKKIAKPAVMIIIRYISEHDLNALQVASLAWVLNETIGVTAAMKWLDYAKKMARSDSIKQERLLSVEEHVQQRL